jgi:hypothetical protein
MNTYTIQGPSIASIAAGLHECGDVVTVTGIANGQGLKETRDGTACAAFDLIGDNTAIRMLVFPRVYAETGDQLDPVKEPDGSLRPSTVQVTGKVDRGWGARPELVAQSIVRLSAGEPVAVAPIDFEALRKVAAIRDANEGVSLDEAIASLRNSEGGGAR